MATVAYALGAAEGLGIVSLGYDLGLSLKVQLHMDAAAALCMLQRRGWKGTTP